MLTTRINAVKLSEDLLLATKNTANVDHYIEGLSTCNEEQLYNELAGIDSRKTFWINIYNAFVQILLKKQEPDLKRPGPRRKFFNSKSIYLSEHLLSLNDIEHGMLRHSALLWGFGYLRNSFPNHFEKKMRIPLDYRIHFALNCGAKSCPAISYYSPGKLDDQLDQAMNSFLEEDVEFNKHSRILYVSSIFNWYRGDFGGKAGIINLLWRNHLIPSDRKTKLRFKPYDWELMVGKFNLKIG